MVKRILYIFEVLIALFFVLKYPVIGDIVSVIVAAIAVAYFIETPII